MHALAPPVPPLSDGTIALRGFESTDVPAIVAACQDPEIPRWTLVPSPYGAQDAHDYVRRMPSARAAGRALSLAIVDAADHDRLLGSIALNPVVWEQRAADVGYWVAAHARGRGVATRAVRMLADWAFRMLRLERLELRTQRDNHASQAIAAHAGFEPVASPVVRRPECEQLPDEHLPDVFFARVRGE